jgi:DNA-binding MarR family transcriptional regulator
MEADPFERAIAAYAEAIRILDPIRFQLWSDRGLTMPQARVLFTLVEHDNKSAGELADRIGVAPPTLTGITDRLVRQSLIERKEDPRDRRVVRLALTLEGRRLTLEIAESSRAYLRRVFEAMPPERLAQLAACLEDLARANAASRDPEPLEVT